MVHPLSGSSFSIPGRIGICKFCFLGRGENGSPRNQQHTINPKNTSTQGFEPGQHCWEAYAFPALAILAPLTKRFIKDCAYMETTICINVSFQVTMSYLQIYQEKIYDLLNSTSKIELSLREHPVKGEDIYVTYTWLYVQVRLSLGVTKLRDNRVKDYRDTVYLGKNLMYGVREKYGPWHTYGVRRTKPDMFAVA